uniref:Uncharacterized protein n=1 Tax=Physcomitrium patens TaxID=3218 RepID=A0A2K1KDU4_PHYPA|nr:hypothetical protein PHYPA_008326 [Physcomitrium patens]
MGLNMNPAAFCGCPFTESSPAWLFWGSQDLAAVVVTAEDRSLSSFLDQR